MNPLKRVTLSQSARARHCRPGYASRVALRSRAATAAGSIGVRAAHACPAAQPQVPPAICLVVTLSRLNRLVVAMARMRAASPFSS